MIFRILICRCIESSEKTEKVDREPYTETSYPPIAIPTSPIPGGQSPISRTKPIEKGLVQKRLNKPPSTLLSAVPRSNYLPESDIESDSSEPEAISYTYATPQRRRRNAIQVQSVDFIRVTRVR